MSVASNLSPAYDEITSEFTFVWKISNLSHCSVKNDQSMVSPKFNFSSSTWQLLFYPRKKNPALSAQCELYNCLTTNGQKRFIGKFVCHFCVCSTSQQLLHREETEVSCTSQSSMLNYYLAKFGREIFEKLPDDVIVLHCHMGKPALINSVKHPLHLFAETRISLRRNIFYWKIEKFSSLQLDEDKTYSFSTKPEINPSLTLKLFLLGTNLKDATVQIWLNFNGLSLYDQTFSSCALCLNDTNERTLKCIKNDGWLGSVENVMKISFKREEISAWGLPDDTLILRGEVSLSVGNADLEQVVDNMETKEAVAAAMGDGLPGIQTKSVPPSASENRPSALSADMLSLFKGNGPPSDFELRVAGRSFPVHQVVVGARSTVFRAMFANDMPERSEKSLELTDIDADTGERMLQYVYSDEEPSSELDWESVADLYAAADKYALLGLRKICGDRLVQGLDEVSVPRVLQTADRHRDHLLKKQVVDFVIEQGSRAIESENWKKLEEDDPKLAIEVLRQIIQQKGV